MSHFMKTLTTTFMPILSLILLSVQGRGANEVQGWTRIDTQASIPASTLPRTPAPRQTIPQPKN
jgi:hypothetical protein